MCGHGSIGTASMVVETGMVPAEEPHRSSSGCSVRSDLCNVHVVDGKAKEVNSS